MLKLLPVLLLSGFVFLFSNCNKADLLEDDNSVQPELKSAVVASASGHGTINDYPAPGLKRQFSFNANMKADGAVKGRAIVVYTKGEVLEEYEIDCMVIKGNMAKFSGVMTASTDKPYAIGRGIVFAVWDNGEGEVAQVNDKITLVFVDLPSDVNCATFIPSAGYTYTIDGGNVQIRP